MDGGWSHLPLLNQMTLYLYSYVYVHYFAPCGCNWPLYDSLTFAMLLNGIYASIILSLSSRVFVRSVFLRGMGPIVCQSAVVVRKRYVLALSRDALSFLLINVRGIVKICILILKKVPVMLYMNILEIMPA